MPETMTIPVISTAHLRSEFAIDDLGVLHAKYEYGYFVWMDDAIDILWFERLCAWAAEHAPDGWVRFDNDGEIIPELPTFDW